MDNSPPWAVDNFSRKDRNVAFKKKKPDIKVCAWCSALFIGASCQSHTITGVYCKAGCVKKAEEWARWVSNKKKAVGNVKSR